jgi:hypothetical protein
MTKSTTNLLEVAFFALLAFVIGILTRPDSAPTQTPHQSIAAVTSVTMPTLSDTPVKPLTPAQQSIAHSVLHSETLYPVEQRFPAPHYSTLPMPTNEGDWNGYKLMIVMAAKYADVDPAYMAATAGRESNFVATAQPISNKRAVSSATGVYQFIDSTWNTMVKRYGAQYGITLKTPKTDPRANALMGAEYAKENKAYLESILHRKIQPTEMYMAHLLGAGGALSIIKARSTALAINVRPDAVSGNRALFYSTVNGVSKPVTVYEFRKRLRQHTAKLQKLYGESAIAYSDLLSGTDRLKPMVINYQYETNPMA